jgi:signal transduction histidine kinase
LNRAAPLAVLAAGVLASAIAGIAAGSLSDALQTAAILAVVGGSALAGGALLARHRERIGSLRRLLMLATAIAVAQLLIAAAAFAGLMFLSAHDALLLSLLAVYCAVAGAAAVRPVAHGVLDDVAAVREGLDAVAAGERDLELHVGGGGEIAALAGSARVMASELAAQEDARRRLVTGVSHDLRTPITALRLLADGLRDDVIPPEERAAGLDRMAVHLRTLSALIDDLFELSRLESGKMAWSMQRVHLGALVEEAIDAMRPAALAKAVTVRAHVPDGLAPASADPERLQRVLFNLIQNAIRHTPADGSVTVRAEIVDDGLQVEVADTGPGIPAGERERIFEAFQRGRSVPADGGAGLGLAISRAIVEGHGGRIWLEPGDGGARVRFSLHRA